MLENKIQKKIIDYLEKEKSFFVIKQIKTNKNGIPDLLVLIWWWKHFWIEVKQEKWIESKIQEYRRQELNSIWDTSLICYWFNDFINKFDLFIKSL